MEIFSSGKSYFDYMGQVKSRYEASEKLRQGELDFSLERNRGAARLATLKKQYLIQKENVAALKLIADASQVRFRRGTVDSKQVNDDLQAYLTEQDKLVELSLSIVTQVADLAKLVGSPSLFDQLI